MSEPLFWVGLVIGLFAGVTVGTFVVGLMMATRDEQQKTGHNGPARSTRYWEG